ncbi:MAG: dTMP kinase [Treponema sp.]|jgi:dTMP kinase|nr:dTMP kinase [Treponema sp.]
MEIIPNFIVFEGCDGSGTTTQLDILADRVRTNYKDKLPFYRTFEPTELPVGKIIRNVLSKENPLQIKPETLTMLFAADRNEHLYGNGGILERIKKGEIVASDRYVLSSLVYQGIECGDELPALLNSRFPAPEITLFIDVKPSIAFARIIKTRTSFEIFEKQEFQEKVYENYLSQIDKYRSFGARVEIIDGSKNIDEVAQDIWSIIKLMPIFNV